MTSSAGSQGKRAETGLTRRELMRALGLSAGGVALLGVPLLGAGATARAATATPARGYVAGRVTLEVDGVAAPVSTVDGGSAFAIVAPDAPSGDNIQHKHLTNVAFEDIVVQVPLGAAQPLMGWIGGTLAKGPTPKNGALVYYDFNFTQMKRLEFFNAVLTEVTLPTCDAADVSGAALLTLRLTPESTRLAGPSATAIPANSASKATAARANLFRVNIKGLEAACPAISKVTALSAKRAPPIGEMALREKARVFGALDCSALSITLAEKDAGLFFGWFNDFVINGRNGAGFELPGRIEWLNPTGSSVVAAADLINLGIVRYAPGATTAGDSIARVQVDLYCEAMNLTVA